MLNLPTRVSGRALSLAMIVGLAACGAGHASSMSMPSTTTAPIRVLNAAGSRPAASTQMICGPEGTKEIGETVGVEIVRPLVPRWKNHVYSCDYYYANGRTTLSVKELSSAAETRGYFDALGARLGRTRALSGLGQGAYQTTNGSTVVRKDSRVLLVDVANLPSNFGTPSAPRADVSLSIAATIMGCWTGA